MKKLDFFAEEWAEFLENIDFTDTERQIIQLVRRGWYQEDIAAELDCSRSKVTRIYGKIGDKITRYILRQYKR